MIKCSKIKFYSAVLILSRLIKVLDHLEMLLILPNKLVKKDFFNEYSYLLLE